MKVLISSLLFLFSSLTYGDNILKTLEEAKTHYKNKRFTEAQNALEDATTFIQQKRGKFLEQSLPGPLSGWKEHQSRSQSIGKKMFGGGLTVFKKYKKGRSQIKISLITDSPLIQSYLGAFSNTFLNAGGELIRENGGKKGNLKYNNQRKNGNLTSMIDNRFLLKIEGRHVEKKDLISYFKAFEVKKVQAL